MKVVRHQKHSRGFLNLASCNRNLLDFNSIDHETFAVTLSLDKYSSIILAYFDANNGHNLKFVENRPLTEDINFKDFWELCNLGLKLLNDGGI